ncbi:MAG: sigma factor-like helix-turn-helix DNA-binding protein [Microthrixaceae bacterium]
MALERLNPLERAALVLRDVFDLDYSDIAEVIDRTPAATRQITGRARDRVGDPQRSRGPASDAELAVRDDLLAALLARDVEAVTRVLSSDVIAWSDGGSSCSCGSATRGREPPRRGSSSGWSTSSPIPKWNSFG